MNAHEPLLRAMFDAAVASAQPAVCVPPYLTQPPAGRTIIVGAGKASAAMARSAEANWPRPLEGVVVTRYGHHVPCEHVQVMESAHPVPDTAGVTASRQILKAVTGLTPDDLVLVLISGGASALMSLPAPGISLDDKIRINQNLLASGATIHEINCVRKHLSAIKGGQLAMAAQPARVITLAISDVAGDDPAVIGSGPTVPDNTSAAQAEDILARYGIDPGVNISRHLQEQKNNTPVRDLPKPDYRLIATPAKALAAAAAIAEKAGYRVQMLGDAVEGEARVVARQHARMALESPTGTVLLSGGELTVTMRGTKGRGGPNTEYLLSLAIALEGAEGISAIACDTDGSDGMGDQAGACCGPSTLERAREAGLNPSEHLNTNDSAGFFAPLSNLVITGPTQTNVNDFRAIVVGSPQTDTASNNDR